MSKHNLNYIKYLSGVINEDQYYEMEATPFQKPNRDLANYITTAVDGLIEKTQRAKDVGMTVQLQKIQTDLQGIGRSLLHSGDLDAKWLADAVARMQLVAKQAKESGGPLSLDLSNSLNSIVQELNRQAKTPSNWKA